MAAPTDVPGSLYTVPFVLRGRWVRSRLTQCGALVLSLCVLSAPAAVLAGAPDPLSEVIETLRDGDTAAALAMVERLDPDLRSSARVSYLHARLLDAQGRRDEALSQLPTDTTGLPAAIAQDVEQRRGRWQQVATGARATSRTPPQPAPRTAIEKLERAEQLLKSNREQAVIDLLRGTPPRSLRGRWYHTRGMALFKLRNRYAEAAQVLALAASFKSETQAFDAFHAARALARADRDAQSIVELRKFARKYPTSSYAAEAMYLAAWLELRLGRAVGLANMEKFARSDLAKSAPAFKQQALWTLGYHRYVRGRPQDAVVVLLESAELSPHEMGRNGGRYWAARAKHDAEDVEGAIALWQQLIGEDPFHWYSLLSRARLTQAGQPPVPVPPPPTTTEPPAADATPSESPALPDDVAFYAGIGLFDDARAALRRQEATVKAATTESLALQILARAYHAVGEHTRPYQFTVSTHAQSLMTAWTADTDWIWRTAMATPYRALVEHQAREHDVEVAYVYAIMRKESAFDPKVVSYADALGLMQLLHGTAIKVARAIGDPEPSRADLFRPSINIRLGTALLAQLERELGPERSYGMAGYNAGSHRVKQWKQRVSAPELDRFVEEIPIEQTRNYVRRVHANWARYRYLLEPEREPVTLHLDLR